MKRFLFFALIFMPLLSISQEQFPVFSEDNIWSINGYNANHFYDNVQILGDTIIEGKHYKIINDNTSENILGFGYDENKQTFFRPIESPINEDILIYDFNLEIGDTFNLPYPINPFLDTVYFEPIIVLDIDYVGLSDGSLRKKYVFNDGLEYNPCTDGVWVWIDGIGSPMHPTY